MRVHRHRGFTLIEVLVALAIFGVLAALAQMTLGQTLSNSAMLNERMDRLQKELTSQELDDPEKLKQTLRSQQTEINTRIQEQAEQILQLRQKIESLVDYYRDRHP